MRVGDHRIPARLAVLALAAALAMAGPAAAQTSSHGDEPVGIVLDPLFRLITHTGGSIARTDLRRIPFVVVFGYTNCADVCPTSLFTASTLLEELGEGGDRLRVLFVTVDPERDTPQQLKAYLASFDSRIVGLSGTREQVAAATEAFTAPFRQEAARDGLSHSSQFFLMDKYGLLAKAVDYTATDEIGKVARRLLMQ